MGWRTDSALDRWWNGMGWDGMEWREGRKGKGENGGGRMIITARVRTPLNDCVHVVFVRYLLKSDRS